MLLRQLSYAIKTQLKAPKGTRGISYLSLVLYGMRIDYRRWRKQYNDLTHSSFSLYLPTYQSISVLISDLESTTL